MEEEKFKNLFRAKHGVKLSIDNALMLLETEGIVEKEYFLTQHFFRFNQRPEPIKRALKERFKDNGCRIFLEDNSKFLWEFSRECIVDNKCSNVEEYTTMLQNALRKYKKEYCFKKNKAIKPKTACSWFEPIRPVMHLVGSEKKEIKAINAILDKYQESEVKDVIILTQGTIEYSCIADNLEVGTGNDKGYHVYYYNGVGYKVTTCRKFKGLEADAIVMIDLNKDSFTGRRGMRFYVGTSRAKQYLDVVAVLAPQDYGYVVKRLDPNAPQRNDNEKMKKVLGSVFSADIMSE